MRRARIATDVVAALATGDVMRGIGQGLLLGAVVAALALPVWRQRVAEAPPAAPAVTAPAATFERKLDVAALAASKASNDLKRVAQWVVDSADNGSHPFVIVDKREAKVFLFERDGRLLAASPVLLGYARGDHTVPGIGERAIADVRPFERTTPAGRFVARPGRNAGHEPVLWVDYDAAVSMHRLRATDPVERRAERLASPTSADNRISYGCINLPPAFFEGAFWPRFGGTTSIVYVLPEVWPLSRAFPTMAL